MSEQKPDFYESLGVDRQASDADLKKAYRKQAMRYHPDRNPNDKKAEKNFKNVNEAYDTLKDPDKRAAYDRFGHAAFQNGGMGGAGASGFEGGFGGFSDIFEEMFGGNRREAQRPQRGADLQYNLDISLEQAFSGDKITISVPNHLSCTTCKGSGAKAGTSPTSCASCGGRGRVRAAQGFFSVERTCPHCQGTGKTITNPCPDCRGKGRVQKTETLEVTVPAGVDDGTRIRLAGKGEPGPQEGLSGDLYIFLHVRPSRIFSRSGHDIFCTIPLPMTTGTLGGSIDVPTIEGNYSRLTIPDGTQTGKKFRLRGKGFSVYNSSRRGDMIVEVQLETPTNLSKEQKNLLKEFAKISGDETTSPASASFFAKVKEFFGDS